MVNARIYRGCMKSLCPQGPAYLSPLRLFSSLLPHHPGGICFGLTPGRHLHISRSSNLTHDVSLNNPSNHIGTSGGPQSLASLDLPSDKQSQSKSSRHNPQQLWPLVRAVIVQSICSSPLLVRFAPNLLYHLFSTPSNTALSRIKSFFTMPIIEVIKVTLFEHFVPSDSLNSKLFRTLDSLAQPSAKGHGGAGSILNFAAEPPVDHKGSMTAAEIRNILEQNLEAIRAARAYKAFVAIKVSSLLCDPTLLERISQIILQNHPTGSDHNQASSGMLLKKQVERRTVLPECLLDQDFTFMKSNNFLPTGVPGSSCLSDVDWTQLELLLDHLRTIFALAHSLQVSVLVDAEYSHYQPALDIITTHFAMEFNRIDSLSGGRDRPVIYNTIQSYLRRTIPFLQSSIAHAKKHQYCLGVKLVRGAYVDSESRHHEATPLKSRMPEPPIWASKTETDMSFDDAATRLVTDIANGHVSAIFATHNMESVRSIIDQLVTQGLALPGPQQNQSSYRIEDQIFLSSQAQGQLHFAQLYQFADHLMDYVNERVSNQGSQIEAQPLVLKYIPFGPVELVLPYLVRRAQENSSVLQGQNGSHRERQDAWAKLRSALSGPLD